MLCCAVRGVMVSQGLHTARRYRKPIHARKKKKATRQPLPFSLADIHTYGELPCNLLCNAGHFSALFCQNSKLWFCIIAVDGGLKCAGCAHSRAEAKRALESFVCGAHSAVRCVVQYHHGAPVGNNGMRNILPPCK